MKQYPVLSGFGVNQIYAFCKGVAQRRAEDIDEVYRLNQHARAVSTLAANVTPVGNVTTGEDDLMGYTLPNGFYTKDGHYAVVEASFATAANANTKSIKYYFGSTLMVLISSTLNNKTLYFRSTIIRTGEATQIAPTEVFTNDSTVGACSFYLCAASENMKTPVTVKFTGEGTSTDDIVQKTMTVRWFPANIELA